MANQTPLKSIYTGDDLTGLGEFASTDTVPIANGGTGATTADGARLALALGLSADFSIDEDGYVSIGGASNDYHRVCITEGGSAAANLLLTADGDSYGPGMTLHRTRASNAAVVDGDLIGKIAFAAWDGSTGRGQSAISAFVNGTVATGDVPTNLIFYTTPTGSITAAERARITPAGDLGVGVTPAARLHVLATTEQLRLGYDATKYVSYTVDADGFQSVAGGISEPPTVANTSTAYTIGARSLYDLTLTGNCTFTFPTATAGRQFTLVLNQDSTGSRTVTWPSSVRWPGGTAPTITATASKTDVFSFLAVGTYWLGFTGSQLFTRA
jgi:hypothetical protein